MGDVDSRAVKYLSEVAKTLESMEKDWPYKAQELVTAMGPLVRRHLVLVARVSAPKLKEAAHASLDQTEGMYTRAAAALMAQDRQEAGVALATANIQSLEAEPQDLASALVNYYFMVKETSIL